MNEALKGRLYEIWNDVGLDIAPHVESNEDAVDALMDRAFDRLTVEERVEMLKLSPRQTAKHLKLV